MGLPRHRIADGACLQQAELADAGLVGTQLVHQFALGNQKLRCRQRRIVRLLDRNAIGLSDMNARPVNMNVSHSNAPATGRSNSPTCRRQIGPHMGTQKMRSAPWRSNTPLSLTVLAPPVVSSAGWNTKRTLRPNGARMLANRTVDMRCGGKRHGHVSIVSASVHLSGMRRRQRPHPSPLRWAARPYRRESPWHARRPCQCRRKRKHSWGRDGSLHRQARRARPRYRLWFEEDRNRAPECDAGRGDSGSSWSSVIEDPFMGHFSIHTIL